MNKWLDRLSLKQVMRTKPVPLSPQGVPYATFQRRMIANIVDMVILSFAFAPFNHLILQWAYSGVQIDQVALEAAVSGAATATEANRAAMQVYLQSGMLEGFVRLAQLQFTVMAVYSFIFWRMWGATPGKRVLRMRIVHATTGAAPSDGQYIVRVFGYLFSGLPFLLGFFAIGWSKRKQGWHDWVARTAVIVVPKATAAPAAAGPSDSPAPGAGE